MPISVLTFLRERRRRRIMRELRRRARWADEARHVVALKDFSAEETGRMDSNFVQVDVYLDTDDTDVIVLAMDAFDELVSSLGYDSPSEVRYRLGSIFRRSMARIRRGLGAAELAERLAKVERAFELAALDTRQADVDSREAEAVARLLAALEGTDRACLRVGSLLVAKYVGPDGQKVILTRNLSQLEIRALERLPEIQFRPEQVLQALATALSEIHYPLE